MTQPKTALEQAHACDGARKAALRLSGVSEVDRRWILQRLEPAQRARISRALQELQRITGDRPLDFRMFLDEPKQAEPAGEVAAGALAVNRLPYASLASLLNELPDHYTAIVLNSGQWQGGDRYLRECPANRRKALAELKPVVTPHASAALLLELAALAAGEAR